MNLTTEKIWTDHHKQLQGFILAKVNSEDACNDILQDVFMRIHLNLHKLEKPERIQQWVFQISRNAINDHFRKQKLFANVEDVDLEDPSLGLNSNGKFAKCMSSFIKDLPKKYQEAITKVEIENMSQLNFAKQLNISYSGAKSRVQRAKELLKSYFLECCNVNTDKYGNIISLKGPSKCGTCEV
jgi:RNA polymerase sigma-70 factor (ECF subfamily)